MNVTQERTQAYGRSRKRPGLDDAALPMLVGRYWLLEQIATGGMATVYKGRLDGPEGFARTVAIKRLHPHLASNAGFVEQFATEARLAARIHHGNVVQTLDLVHDQGELFLVLEYVDGLTLSALLGNAREHQSRLPTSISGGILFGALQGLSAAHELADENGRCLHLVHQDFSPQNILVGVDGVGRVLDFGVARVADRQAAQRRNKIEGKLSYMSPEQITAQQVDQRSDIFSAGIVLWEAFAGRRLFGQPGLSEEAVTENVLQLEILPPSTFNRALPKALDEVVLRALQRDPEQRFPAAREFATALHSAISISSSSEISAYLRKDNPAGHSGRGIPVSRQDQTRTACELDLGLMFAGANPQSSIRRSLKYFALALAAGAGGGYLWPASSPTPVSMELAAAPPSRSTASSPIPSTAPEMNSAATPVPVQSAASAASGPNPRPVRTAITEKRAPVRTAITEKRAPRTQQKASPRPRKEAAAPTQTSDCSVPTYTDAEGISHFKVHCL